MSGQQTIIFDTVADFTATIPGIVQGRERADVVPVYVDSPHEDFGMSYDPVGPQPRQGNVTLFPVTGHALGAVFGPMIVHVPTGAVKNVCPSYFAPEECDHPVDVAFRQKRISPDAVAVVYAGAVEWMHGFANTRRLLQRLPGGRVYLLTCNCVKDDKVTELASLDFCDRISGLIFTDECMAADTMLGICNAFLYAGAAQTA